MVIDRRRGWYILPTKNREPETGNLFYILISF